jgi:HNH endonuclease
MNRKAEATVEVPQSFIVREECEKVASQNGFRRVLGEKAGWAAFGSTTAEGRVFLGASGGQGPWFLALSHAGVIAELGLARIEMPGPGLVRFAFDNLGALYGTLRRVYELTISLPDAPLRAFATQVANLPRATEVERLVVQRIGQDIFRAGLMDYWQGRCPLTGISDPALLRASHIIPWADCESDAERLNVHNGLLLSALWDAAFDRALVTFDDEGQPEFATSLSEQARAELRWQSPIALTNEHRRRLAIHRKRARRPLAGTESPNGIIS